MNQKTYGGFYTQDDIKEVVQYAKERFVNIMPEIDAPGHSIWPSVLRLFLILNSPVRKRCNNIGVTSGEEIKRLGIHIQLWYDDNLCPANENVYAFLDKVVTELAQLFPFEYIHMGGDETFKHYWEKAVMQLQL